MTTLAPLLTLRATNCYGLAALSAQLIAALGPRTSYLLPSAGGDVVADVAIPKEASTYALWAPAATADAASVYVIYAATDDASAQSGLRVLRASQSDSEARVVALASAPSGTAAEEVRSLRVLFQGVLVVERDSRLELFLLDAAALTAAAAASSSSSSALASPAAATLPLLGSVTLAVSPRDRAETPVLVSPNSTGPSAGSQEVLVACLNANQHTVSVQVVAVSASSAAVVRRTESRGVALPPALRHPLIAWSVNWATQELVLLCRAVPSATNEESDDDDKDVSHGDRTRCGALSLRRADVASGNHITRWLPQPSFVNAATRPLLDRASDLLCCGEHAVYIVDSTTGPTVVLRNVASSALEELVLANTSISAKTLSATQATADGQSALYMLAGRSVFLATPLSSGPSTSSPSAAAAAAVSAVSTGGSGGATASNSAAARLRRSLAQPSSTPATAAQTAQSSPQTAAASEANAMLSRLIKTGGAAQGGAAQAGASAADVVRDVRFVLHDGERNTFSHALLESAAFAKLKATEKVQVALRYTAIAESLHPYTALLLLAAVPVAAAAASTSTQSAEDEEREDYDGARLALAVLLSRKSTLRDGGLQRHTALAASTAGFMRDVAVLTQKQFLAALCRTSMTALAVGALGAAAILHTLADAVATQLYGRNGQRESQPLVQRGESPAELSAALEAEATIADAVSRMKQYSQWALTDAATALGTVSAHVGEAREGRKEACLRDAHSHPIATSRNVDIKALRLTRTTGSAQSQ